MYLTFLDFKIPEDNWDESDSSDMDSYGSDCDDMSGNKLGQLYIFIYLITIH